MKIKVDFVTNSSSTSYIVAVRKINETDDIVSSLPPMWRKLIEQGMKTFTKGESITNEEELIEYMKDHHGWYPGKEVTWNTDYEEKLYAEIKEQLDRGYNVYDNDIDYHEEYLNELFSELPDDPSEAIFLMRESG